MAMTSCYRPENTLSRHDWERESTLCEGIGIGFTTGDGQQPAGAGTASAQAAADKDDDASGDVGTAMRIGPQIQMIHRAGGQYSAKEALSILSEVPHTVSLVISVLALLFPLFIIHVCHRWIAKCSRRCTVPSSPRRKPTTLCSKRNATPVCRFF